MKRKIFLFFCLAFLFAKPLFAQSVVFDNTYGFSDYSSGRSIVQLPDSQFVFVATVGTPNGNAQLLLAKLDKMGKPLFFKKTENDAVLYDARDLKLAQNGDFLISGAVKYPGTGYVPFCMRTDTDFEILWQKTIPSGDWAFARKMVELPGGEIVTVGETYDTDSTAMDAFFAKFSAKGDLLEVKKSGLPGNDALLSVEMWNGNTLLASGFQWNAALQDSVPFFSFLDFDGSVKSKYSYEMFKNQAVAAQAVKDSKENIVSVGYTMMYDTAYKKDFYLLALDSVGNFVYDLYVDLEMWSGADDEYQSVTVSQDGYVFAAGTCSGNNYLQPTILVHRLDNEYNWLNGTVRVGAQYDKSDVLSQMIPTLDGGCVLIGTTTDLGTHLSDILVCKLDAQLNGMTKPQHYLPVREKNADVSNIGLYPNPASTQISLVLPAELSGAILISCYDLSMRNLWSYNEYVVENETVNIPLNDIPNGCYFLKISNAKNSAVKKIVVNR